MVDINWFPRQHYPYVQVPYSASHLLSPAFAESLEVGEVGSVVKPSGEPIRQAHRDPFIINHLANSSLSLFEVRKMGITSVTYLEQLVEADPRPQARCSEVLSTSS